MKLLPRLVKSEMFVACSGEVGSIEHKLVDVEVWEKIGLAIHEYGDSVTDKWRISHVNSGRSILRHIKNRKEAIYYLLVINDFRTSDGFSVNWRATEEYLKDLEYRKEVIEMLRVLQQEISGERK